MVYAKLLWTLNSQKLILIVHIQITYVMIAEKEIDRHCVAVEEYMCAHVIIIA